jgi:hypothetical protein
MMPAACLEDDRQNTLKTLHFCLFVDARRRKSAFREKR